MANKDKKFKTETGGLQEKKVKVAPTKEEIKVAQQEIREKRAAKAEKNRKERIGLIQRFRDIGGELRKVNWPTFGHAVKQTGVVLGIVLLFSIVVFGIDMGLRPLYDLLTKGL